MGVEKTGWLVKEGGSIKTWKKRYFVLRNGELSYFKNPGEEALGTIALVGGATSGIEISDSKKKPHCFQIVTPSRTYLLSADNDDERKAWLDALNEARELANSRAEKVSVNDFDLLTLVGKGSFGKVMQVRKKDTGKIYAMKVLDKKHILEHNEVEHTLSEKNILQKLHHPFLVNLNYSFQTEDKLYFILDYVNGGELFYHLQREKRFPEPRVQFYAAEILLALEYLHAHGIIYRDLKPENLLLTSEGHIVLTDFGLCKEGIKDDEKTGTFCGTPEYLAPEVLKGKGYGKAVDWWSFGSLVYEMLTGLPPFYSQDVQEMYRKIMTEKLKFPQTMSENAVSLLEALLQRDVNLRLKDPPQIKQHPFFQGINWEALVAKKVPTPYIPPVTSEDDVSQIDPVFVEEPARISVSEGSQIEKEDQQNFEGFTYVNESSMDKKK